MSAQPDKQTTERWFVVALVLCILCLSGVALAHRSYAQAEAVYRAHLGRVVIRPGDNIAATLRGYSATVEQRLRVQTITCGLTALAVVNVLVQVARRRNERLKLVEADA